MTSSLSALLALLVAAVRLLVAPDLPHQGVEGLLHTLTHAHKMFKDKYILHNFYFVFITTTELTLIQ